MARRRHLRPEEEELWNAVARTATPLHRAKNVLKQGDAAGQGRIVADPFDPPPPVHMSKPRLDAFRLGEKAKLTPKHDIAPPLREQISAAPLAMDAKVFGKMTRGKLMPEARIDLHGLTLAEAHPDLIRFILNAQSGGLRLVLVITGKGKRGEDYGPIPQRMGALRHQVPQWLRLPPLGQAVLQVTEAHLRHGGSGAYYVYLRRR